MGWPVDCAESSRSFAPSARAREFCVRALPGSFKGGDLALGAGEEFGGGGVGEERDGEGGSGIFGE
jgi:hypothetical protein